jgi:peptide/nickel transport system permease protein
MQSQYLWARLKQDPFMFSVAVVGVLLILGAFIVPLFVQESPNTQNLLNRLQAPSWLGGTGGLLGTDELGRPLWLRILYGLRVSYLVPLSAVLIAAVFGIAIGLVAGFYGGWVDSVLMRFTDAALAFPGLLFAMLVTAIAKSGAIVVIIIVLAMLSWMRYARVVRAGVLRLRQSEFIASSTTVGLKPHVIIFRHLLPNTIGIAISVATLEVGRLMIAEASLSFLGFGVQPPGISLGLLLSDGQQYLAQQWWLSTFAGLALALAVITVSLVGNWLYRVTDPVARNQVIV